MSAPEPTEEHTLPERLTHLAGIYRQLAAEAWQAFDVIQAVRHRAMAEAMQEAARIAEEWPPTQSGQAMNLDDLTDNERTILAAIAQREASSWVFPGTSVPISYPECGRRALRWLEIAAMFNADYTPQEWVVETATAWAARKDDHDQKVV